METQPNKIDYKFLKYKAEFESKFITLSNKFKVPKNELFGSMVIYFDKTNRDPRELNFDNSIERVIKILNKNERDYLKPIYSYLLDNAIQKDDTIQLLEALLNNEKNREQSNISALNKDESLLVSVAENGELNPATIEKIHQLFMAFANEISKANEFEKREIFINYKEKLNSI